MPKGDTSEGEETVSEEKEEEAKTSETQETSTDKKPETTETKAKETEELFVLPDGRKVDSQTLSREWKENFYPEFSRRSNELQAFKKAEAERKTKVEEETRQAVGERLKNVPPDVKEAIIEIVKPILDERFSQTEKRTKQEEADRRFVGELDTLEKEFSGKDGRPKFDRREVLKAMQSPNNRNFDPRLKFLELKDKEFLDFRIKEALKQQKGGIKSELTGRGEISKKPEGKTPKTFAEARERAFSRLRGDLE